VVLVNVESLEIMRVVQHWHTGLVDMGMAFRDGRGVLIIAEKPPALQREPLPFAETSYKFRGVIDSLQEKAEKCFGLRDLSFARVPCLMSVVILRRY
jgi:hypothetical protein